MHTRSIKTPLPACYECSTELEEALTALISLSSFACCTHRTRTDTRRESVAHDDEMTSRRPLWSIIVVGLARLDIQSPPATASPPLALPCPSPCPALPCPLCPPPPLCPAPLPATHGHAHVHGGLTTTRQRGYVSCRSGLTHHHTSHTHNHAAGAAMQFSKGLSTGNLLHL